MTGSFATINALEINRNKFPEKDVEIFLVKLYPETINLTYYSLGVHKMKKDTHPDYQQVLFIDSASGHRFVCGSTLKLDATEKFEGKEYPVCYLSISSTSHPFFTGSKGLVDSEGRIEKFKKRFGRKQEAGKEDSSQDQNQQHSSQEQSAPEKKAASKKA